VTHPHPPKPRSLASLIRASLLQEQAALEIAWTGRQCGRRRVQQQRLHIREKEHTALERARNASRAERERGQWHIVPQAGAISGRGHGSVLPPPAPAPSLCLVFTSPLRGPRFEEHKGDRRKEGRGQEESASRGEEQAWCRVLNAITATKPKPQEVLLEKGGRGMALGPEPSTVYFGGSRSALPQEATGTG